MGGLASAGSSCEDDNWTFGHGAWEKGSILPFSAFYVKIKHEFNSTTSVKK